MPHFKLHRVSGWLLSLTLLISVDASASLYQFCRNAFRRGQRSHASGLLNPRQGDSVVSNSSRPYAGWLSSQVVEFDLRPIQEGTLPADLSFQLLRVGHGVMERNGEHINHVMAADGYVSSVRVVNGQATRFQTHHVRTEKFAAEAAEGRYLFPTFASTPSAGRSGIGAIDRSLARVQNSAGVAIAALGDRTFVFDEMQREIHEISTEPLRTRGVISIPGMRPTERTLAHFKYRHGGQGIDLPIIDMIPNRHGRMTMGVLELGPNLELRSVRRFEAPRQSSIHDWAVTEDYFIFVLHQQVMTPAGVLRATLGQSAVADAMEINPQSPTMIYLVPKDPNLPPRSIVTPPDFPHVVWHVANAFQVGSDVFIDHTGSSSFTSAGAQKSSFRRAMRGDLDDDLTPSSFFYRDRIGADGSLHSTRLYSAGDCEMPAINPRWAGRANRFVYLVRASQTERGGVTRSSEVLFNAVLKLDTATGTHQVVDFGPGTYVSEPAYIPVASSAFNREDTGYLGVQVFDSNTQRSYTAILDAASLEVIARIHTPRVPFSFHSAVIQRP